MNEGFFLITRNDAPNRHHHCLYGDDDPDCRMLIKDAISECKVSNDIHEVANGLGSLQFLHGGRAKFADSPRPGLIYLDIGVSLRNGRIGDAPPDKERSRASRYSGSHDGRCMRRKIR